MRDLPAGGPTFSRPGATSEPRPRLCLCCGERADALARLWHVLVGVVGGAHEWPGGNVVEAELVGSRFERGELVGVPVAHDRQVALGGAQVLPDGEHADTLLAQRGERLDELVVCLARPAPPG